MSPLKRHPFAFSVLFSLIAFFSLLLPQTAGARSTLAQGIGPDAATPTVDMSSAKVHGYFFYSKDCSHCIDILNQIVDPLLAQYPGQIDLRLLELGNPTYYQALLKVEDTYGVKAEQRGLPTVVLGDQILIGDAPNKEGLKSALENGLQGEGIPFPQIEGIDPSLMVSIPVEAASANPEICTTDNPSACQVDKPIYAAYFYQVGCKECNRVDTDIKYLQTLYPQLVVEEYNIFENTPLANWMAERAGRGQDITVPALFIGDQAWIGEGEITPQALEPVLQQLSSTGSPRFWDEFNPDEAQSSLTQRFQSIGWLAVVLAGLVDGLNPCAFATIVFFVSFLTLSGRKGKEILITGASFTIGVFIAYLLVGLGFYKVLDLVKETLAIVSRIVYIFTAGLCLVLAVLSIRDFFIARKGDLDEMTLTLPKPLRKRINATIHEGGKSTRYYIGAFVTGLLVSLIELACTGQIYLPTIIFMSSVPSLRGKAMGYLLLYNVMFIIPLIIVFILAYYGTTSKQLSDFLKKHAGPVKLGMAVVFILLAGWLIFSLVA